MNSLAIILKKTLIFSHKKAYLILSQKNETLHFPAQARKKIHSGKVSYTSGNGNSEKTSHMFSKESFSYNSGNGNPEKKFYISWTGTLLHIGKGIFGTLVYSRP